MLSRHPPDHLQRLARHIGQPAAVCCGQRGSGQRFGLPQVASACRDLRRARIGLRGLGTGRAAGDPDALVSLGPASPGDGCPRDSQVQGRRPGGSSSAAQPGQQRPAHLHRALHLPGHREDFGQRLIE
jgi:hypothetical protein